MFGPLFPLGGLVGLVETAVRYATGTDPATLLREAEERAERTGRDQEVDLPNDFPLVTGPAPVLMRHGRSVTVRAPVVARRGCFVYCDLAVIAEHSGVYVGDDKVVHLLGTGEVAMTSPEVFNEGLLSGSKIFAACDGYELITSGKAAEVAKKRVGKIRDYNVILDNCHQFTAGCITGKYENSDNFFWMLNMTISDLIGGDDVTWRPCKRFA